ncbi:MULTISPECIES: hypothetical protein [unclassified Pseudomonas]|uniref:hypothetical protein n=1 Tax=unclassified Pseudomonas TaxID=196821 RepID=UPI001C610C01|nr:MULTISPECIES: hypothetical protein [unclassified Pseudomonas]MBW5416113.1 hypothetical protein [Pseudomonas sp. MAG002Y]
MNPLTEARRAFVSHLETILPENGYETSAGTNVRTGWLNEVIQDDQVGYPLIVVQPTRPQVPLQGAEAIKVFRAFNVVGAVSTQLDDYQDALDQIELDLLKALLPSQGMPVSWAPRLVSNFTLGAPEPYPPGNGANVATVLIPVQLHIVINGVYPDDR